MDVLIADSLILVIEYPLIIIIPLLFIISWLINFTNDTSNTKLIKQINMNNFKSESIINQLKQLTRDNLLTSKQDYYYTQTKKPIKFIKKLELHYFEIYDESTEIFITENVIRYLENDKAKIMAYKDDMECEVLSMYSRHEQRPFEELITEFINNFFHPHTDYLIHKLRKQIHYGIGAIYLLSGESGTGKSYVTETIKDLICYKYKDFKQYLYINPDTDVLTILENIQNKSLKNCVIILDDFHRKIETEFEHISSRIRMLYTKNKGYGILNKEYLEYVKNFKEALEHLKNNSSTSSKLKSYSDITNLLPLLQIGSEDYLNLNYSKGNLIPKNILNDNGDADHQKETMSKIINLFICSSNVINNIFKQLDKYILIKRVIIDTNVSLDDTLDDVFELEISKLIEKEKRQHLKGIKEAIHNLSIYAKEYNITVILNGNKCDYFKDYLDLKDYRILFKNDRVNTFIFEKFTYQDIIKYIAFRYQLNTFQYIYNYFFIRKNN